MFKELIEEYSLKNGISPELLASLIHRESSGNPWAVRYEPGFYVRYIKSKNLADLKGYAPPPTLVSNETEKSLRSTSFGLVQIMGQVARERGFEGLFLSQLFDPRTNIELGAAHLGGLLARYGDVETALLRYNGGLNTQYPAGVLDILKHGKYTYLLAAAR